MSDRSKENSQSRVSRRDFLAKSAIGAGAAAALGATTTTSAAAGDAVAQHGADPHRRAVHQIDRRGADLASSSARTALTGARGVCPRLQG